MNISEVLGDFAESTGRLFSAAGAIAPALRVGATPYEVVDEDNASGFRLLRYLPATGATPRKEVLFLPHLVNRYYILDLYEDVSVVRRFCERGFTVDLIDWGYPRKDLGFSDYAGYADKSISLASGDAVSVLAYCTGGIISLIQASLHPDRVRNLVLLATPVDFSQSSDYRILAGRMFGAGSAPAWTGNLPGGLFNAAGWALLTLYMPLFLARPEFNHELFAYEAWRDMWRRARWLADAPPVSASVAVEFVEGCYQENRLIQNRLRIDGQTVDLGRIACPVLNVIARYDHLVPIESAQALKHVYSGPEYREIIFPTSHLGLSVSRKSHRELWPEICSWLETKLDV